MVCPLTTPIRASDLAQRLGLPLLGGDASFQRVVRLSDASAGTLCFSNDQPQGPLPAGAVVIGPPGSHALVTSLIETVQPRLTFARALQSLAQSPGFAVDLTPALVDPSAVVSSSATIGTGVYIGARTHIGHNVVIGDGVRIGEDCRIKSNSVIGEEGFGFVRDEGGSPVRILHLGSVEIGDRVEIGSLNTVCRGTISSTIVESDVKTDDHVHIGHNCRVGRGAILTACVEVSGSVVIGQFAWIGPNASIIDGVSVGARAFIGIGSTVTKDVVEGASVAGNPARSLPGRSG